MTGKEVRRHVQRGPGWYAELRETEPEPGDTGWHRAPTPEERAQALLEAAAAHPPGTACRHPRPDGTEVVHDARRDPHPPPHLDAWPDRG